MQSPVPSSSTISEGFSTAIRKELDTPLSVVLFNALHGLDPDDWGTFVMHVMKGLERRGRFDAGSLRDACLDYAKDWAVVEDPKPNRPREGQRDRLLRIWRACLPMVTAQEWLGIARFVRAGIPGDAVPSRHDELSLLPLGLADDKVTVTVTRDGTEIARIDRRLVTKTVDGETVFVTKDFADVLGGQADTDEVAKGLDEAVLAARKAAKAARADAAQFRVDVARVRSMVGVPLRQDLSPDDPDDAALLEQGVTGAVIQRKPKMADDGRVTVEYVVLSEAEGGLRLRKWTVPSGGKAFAGSERTHLRAVARMTAKGSCVATTESDRDMTYARTELRQEGGHVTWTTTLCVEDGHPELDDIGGILATVDGIMPGTLAEAPVDVPTP